MLCWRSSFLPIHARSVFNRRSAIFARFLMVAHVSTRWSRSLLAGLMLFNDAACYTPCRSHGLLRPGESRVTGRLRPRSPTFQPCFHPLALALSFFLLASL